MPYIEGRVVHDADAHIMETPNWLRDHADPDIRDRIEPLELSGGNELKQTGDPDEQLRDLDAAFDKLKAKHASEKYRADEAAEIMQRKNFAATGSFIAEDRPRPRSHRRRQPARVQHVPQPAPAQLGARQGRRPRVRRGPRAQPRDGRVLLGRRSLDPDAVRAAGRLRSGRGDGRRSAGDERRVLRCWSRPAARSTTPRATSRSTRCGRAQRGRRSDRVPRRRHRRPARRRLLPERPADPARLPRRRGELPLGRLHGHSRIRRCRRWPR